jgi:hypothetical protein
VQHVGGHGSGEENECESSGNRKSGSAYDALAADRDARMMVKAAAYEAGEKRRQQEALVKMRHEIDQRVPRLAKQLLDDKSVEMGKATKQLTQRTVTTKDRALLSQAQSVQEDTASNTVCEDDNSGGTGDAATGAAKATGTGEATGAAGDAAARDAAARGAAAVGVDCRGAA